MSEVYIFGFSLTTILVNFVFYIIASVFLNKCHKLKYGKFSFLSFIPFLHFIVLGKLLLANWLGIILFIFSFITFNVRFRITIDGHEYVILPGVYYWCILLVLFIILLIKYIKLKKDNFYEEIMKE